MSEKRASVDVLILSYSKSERKYQMTVNCVSSLFESESSIDFHVVLVETASAAALEEVSQGRMFGSRCRVVHPEKPFNYNEFLQIEFQAVGKTGADHLLISNNDVLFQNGFASELVHGLELFHSVSPWCPDYHERFLPGEDPYYCGYRNRLEVCGWCLMFRRSILEAIPFDELFPTDFSFWFQDNYYPFQLSHRGFRHALVRNAKVVHLFEQSHGLLDDTTREEFTIGAEKVFLRKIGSRTMAPRRTQPALTIAVPAVSAHLSSSFARLSEKLVLQARGKPVELLSLIDNDCWLPGEKRRPGQDRSRAVPGIRWGRRGCLGRLRRCAAGCHSP